MEDGESSGVRRTNVTWSSVSSVQFSRSVMSDSLRPHESQHARPPCSTPTPGVHSDSRPSSQWCHPAISSSVDPFFSFPQSLPASESFPMSQLFAWGGQSTGVSALAFLPKNTQGWFPLEWTPSHQKKRKKLKKKRVLTLVLPNSVTFLCTHLIWLHILLDLDLSMALTWSLFFHTSNLLLFCSLQMFLSWFSSYHTEWSPFCRLLLFQLNIY